MYKEPSDPNHLQCGPRGIRADISANSRLNMDIHDQALKVSMPGKSPVFFRSGSNRL
jgi:hypothetical protein